MCAHQLRPQPSIRFFQDKRVRVSLFLAEGIQAPSGRLLLPPCTSRAGGLPLGLVRTYDAAGGAVTDQGAGAALGGLQVGWPAVRPP